jgi:histidinol dehydrogenase
VLYAAKKAGASYVAKTGGAQAIAAMAYGTETIPQVDRIVGPGNAYVTEAKRQLCGSVGIDALAGPSELAIVTGDDVDPELVALDLIAQAEHDPMARTYLIATDEAVIAKVASALEERIADAGRREIVDAALQGSRGVVVRDLEQAATVVDELAPEHLLILLEDAERFLDMVSVAGAIFLGEWSAVPFGDYGVASNHVLPTSGTARFSSGLRASDYVTVRSVVRMSGEAAARHARAAAEIASAEGLVGHAKAVEARRERA